LEGAAILLHQPKVDGGVELSDDVDKAHPADNNKGHQGQVAMRVHLPKKK
jgi:hypothetical protein